MYELRTWGDGANDMALLTAQTSPHALILSSSPHYHSYPFSSYNKSWILDGSLLRKHFQETVFNEIFTCLPIITVVFFSSRSVVYEDNGIYLCKKWRRLSRKGNIAFFASLTSPMPSKRKYKAYVAVFKGDPVDFFKYRHTGLWFVPEDDTTHYYFHVTGFTGVFEYERRKNFDPTISRTFAKKVKVGKTKLSLTSSELASLMESVPVKNSDPEFNCQQWVEFALLELFRKGYLSKEQYEEGLNGMIDATMEAADEDLG